MKVDIILDDKTNKYQVRKHEESPETAKVLFTAEDDWENGKYECEDWCQDNGHTYQFRAYNYLIPQKFAADVERKADKIRSYMAEDADKIGWSYHTNVTYRASAAWKDQPTHYAYVGDSGDTGKFNGYTEDKAKSWEGIRAMRYLSELIGMSLALWELGFNLTFDKDGKHTLFGRFPQWVTIDGEEE